ncbi:MAG: hypothetical protein HOP08_09410 [Cyclobacteriaceae bacterium]|nr:hypothetical protein [Cyclobacteriaceae bacterium]
MMIILIRLLLVWFPHPIHVSVTEMEYNEKAKSFQITSRIFIDDLELSVRKQIHQESLDLLEPKNGKTVDDLVRAYLGEHFIIKLDGKIAKINFLTHEIEDAAMICYLEIENVKKIKSLEVTNSVIQEIHSDQSNLVHVTYKGPVKSYRLTSDQPTDTFKFESK